MLIGFWYEKPTGAAAGKKAFLVNRVGDFGFALTIFLIWFEGDRPIKKLFVQAQDLSLGKIEKLDDTQFRGKLSSIVRSINEGLETAVDAVPTKPALHDKDLDSILGGRDVATEDYTPPPVESVAKPTGSVLDSIGGHGDLSADCPDFHRLKKGFLMSGTGESSAAGNWLA